MNKKNILVFFGNERLATGLSTKTPTIRQLINAGYDIKAVVTNYEAPTSRKKRPLEIQQIAEENNIELIISNTPSELIEKLKEINADAAILVAYGRIIPQSVIDVFPKGIINIHPSLLPLHRGPTPIESVILSGEQKTGTSIMQLTRGMDSGPVYCQAELLLKGSETKQELADTLLEQSADILIDILPDILSGKLQPTPQDDDSATYDALIAKTDGVIDWNKSNYEIEREVRAYKHWPKSKTTIGNTQVVITQASVHDAEGAPGKLFIKDKSLGVYCSSGSVVIERLIPSGKNEMDSQSFLAGYKNTLEIE